ncbi:MAG: hypothetical protein KJ583_05735 [Nanoarchaeota archaeon]|nr:hypothetical protein [Nanoarchaeota archaeon]MBU1269252.1 hypothetical protein [Nanoarchaeota archaeon]MBU1604788.1 hypothetical protein [Nanoarchaeota archaeon]
MKKQIHYNSIYSISKTESALLQKINESKLTIFTPRELTKILSWKKQKTHNVLQQLKNKGIIISIKRNTYTTKEASTEKSFQIAVESTSPSYISFWTALSYYGFTEQQPKSIQIVSPKQYKQIITLKFSIIPIKLKKERFFGYKRINNFTIAEKEKCIIDSLAYPKNAGGLQEAVKCLKNAWKELDKQLFIKYLVRFNNKALNARTGYILEKLNLKNIKVQLPSTYVKLNNEKQSSKTASEREKKQRNKKWRIIINEEIN